MKMNKYLKFDRKILKKSKNLLKNVTDYTIIGLKMLIGQLAFKNSKGGILCLTRKEFLFSEYSYYVYFS